MKKLLLTVALGFAGSFAYAADCAVDLSANDAMQYDLKEITVPKSCKEFTINLKHIGKLPAVSMGHNVVISKAADKMPIVSDGMTAKDTDYVKPGDTRVIAASKVIGGGESTSVKFSTEGLETGGDYDFFCSFPGHVALMSGKVIVKE